MENEIIEKNNSELVIYESTDGNIKLDVNLEKRNSLVIFGTNVKTIW